MPFLNRWPVPAEREHECPVPKLRWLPFLVIPRWRVGARWQCGKWDAPEAGSCNRWMNGCGQVWEYTVVCSWGDCIGTWERVE